MNRLRDSVPSVLCVELKGAHDQPLIDTAKEPMLR